MKTLYYGIVLSAARVVARFIVWRKKRAFMKGARRAQGTRQRGRCLYGSLYPNDRQTNGMVGLKE